MPILILSEDLDRKLGLKKKRYFKKTTCYEDISAAFLLNLITKV